MYKLIVIISFLCIKWAVKAQEDQPSFKKEIRNKTDSIFVDYKENGNIYYIDLRDSTYYNGIIYSAFEKEIYIYQIRNGQLDGFYGFYKKQGDTFFLKNYSFYKNGNCLESIDYKLSDSKLVVKNTAKYFYDEDSCIDPKISYIQIKYGIRKYKYTIGYKAKYGFNEVNFNSQALHEHYRLKYLNENISFYSVFPKSVDDIQFKWTIKE